MSALSQRLSDFGYAAGWQASRLLPASAASTIFSLGADLAARRDGAGVQQLRRNLARVVPQADEVELDELTRRALRSYARYWQEMFQLPSMDHKEVSRKVAQAITGVENLDAALRVLVEAGYRVHLPKPLRGRAARWGRFRGCGRRW